jgi:hypothetical protein|uniref:KIB1-4 beta-propeller domain-containing protein n=1 Tax=Fagus sylvatica TaxID=28930 RepID=A0A2N9GZ80_FAGSY
MALGSEPDWAYLPVPVISSILDKLPEPVDHLWFGAVCKQWQSVSKDCILAKQRWSKLLPMLMIPTEKYTTTERRLYSVAEGKIYNVELQVPDCERFGSSCLGWLATVDESSYVTLLNPFKNGITIRLPPIDPLQPYHEGFDYYIYKFILSADPASTPNDYVVVAIYGMNKKLAFIRAGDRSWRHVKIQMISDIIFYNGLVYAVGHRGLIACFNVKDGNSIESELANVRILAPNMDPPRYSDRAYLVESSGGDLLYVHRKLDKNEDYILQITDHFKVYKLRLHEQSGKVMERVELESLGDDTLFVGDNNSMSVSAANFPGCQPNSIYFTHDYIDCTRFNNFYQPHDVGIFNVKDGTFGQHYTLKPLDKKMPPVLWIVPPFQRK